MFHNEAHVWTLLRQGNVDVVPLVGVYSTEAHPFGLVYEYMDGLDLRQYMKNGPNLRRPELVRVTTQLIHRPSPPSQTVDRNSSRLEAHARPGSRAWKSQVGTSFPPSIPVAFSLRPPQS